MENEIKRKFNEMEKYDVILQFKKYIDLNCKEKMFEYDLFYYHFGKKHKLKHFLFLEEMKIYIDIIYSILLYKEMTEENFENIIKDIDKLLLM